MRLAKIIYLISARLIIVRDRATDSDYYANRPASTCLVFYLYELYASRLRCIDIVWLIELGGKTLEATGRITLFSGAESDDCDHVCLQPACLSLCMYTSLPGNGYHVHTDSIAIRQAVSNVAKGDLSRGQWVSAADKMRYSAAANMGDKL